MSMHTRLSKAEAALVQMDYDGGVHDRAVWERYTTNPRIRQLQLRLNLIRARAACGQRGYAALAEEARSIRGEMLDTLFSLFGCRFRIDEETEGASQRDTQRFHEACPEAGAIMAELGAIQNPTYVELANIFMESTLIARECHPDPAVHISALVARYAALRLDYALHNSLEIWKLWGLEAT